MNNHNLTELMKSVMDGYDLWLEIDTEYMPLQRSISEIIARHISAIDTRTIEIFEGGCGTGITSQTILETDDRIILTAVDKSEDMVAMTEDKLRDFPVSRYTLKTVDFVTSLQGPETYDVIATALTIHNLSKPDREQLFSLLSEKLRPGGLFVNGDKIAINDPIAYEKAFDGWVKRLNKFKEKGRADIYESYYDHEHEDRLNKLTESEQLELIKNAGLIDGKIINRTGMYAVATALKP